MPDVPKVFHFSHIPKTAATTTTRRTAATFGSTRNTLCGYAPLRNNRKEYIFLPPDLPPFPLWPPSNWVKLSAKLFRTAQKREELTKNRWKTNIKWNACLINKQVSYAHTGAKFNGIRKLALVARLYRQYMSAYTMYTHTHTIEQPSNHPQRATSQSKWPTRCGICPCPNLWPGSDPCWMRQNACQTQIRI